MAWFMRGVQSAVFHYASCAPCIGYADGRKRRKAAKLAKKARERLELEEPGAYHHPEPTGTNPYWGEEMAMGPGPPRRARRTNTRDTRDTSARSAKDHDDHAWGRITTATTAATSDDTLGHDDTDAHSFTLRRPQTSLSSSYYSAPVNDLHPPVVSIPSPDPADNRWMLQPPPRASVMAGRERASAHTSSASGASSRVELTLQRQLSTRHGSTRKKRRDTAMTRSDTLPYTATRPDTLPDTAVVPPDTASTHSTDTMVAPDFKPIRLHQSRPCLSTIASSGSGTNDFAPLSTHGRHGLPSSDENALTTHHAPLSSSSDLSSLTCLQDLVSPRALLNSPFVSAPLVEAKIRLPPSDEHLQPHKILQNQDTTTWRTAWAPSDLGNANANASANANANATGQIRVPFDNPGPPDRDPRLRWSVDF